MQSARKRAGLGDLISVIHEILAQRGQVTWRRGRSQIAVVALKRRAVCKHGQAGGTAFGIGLGQCGRIKVGADQPFGRAGFFDFGDQAVTFARCLLQSVPQSHA